MKPEDIRALRIAYGMKRELFAKVLGLSKQSLYYWERGTHSPTRYDLIVLLRLWAMLHNPKKRKIAKDVLWKASKLPSCPAEKDGAHIGDFFHGGLQNFGLGLILSTIFKGQK